MRIEGVVLLAAPTARSQAYIQVLVANNLYPEQVIFLGEETPLEEAEARHPKSWRDLLLPDLSEPLSATCRRAQIPVRHCADKDVNSEEVKQAILEAAPQMVIYSGYGGKIVADHVLGLGPDFLHMHSGWLPEYRGSTTLYYALLNGDPPGVTALILDRTIDTGPVLARRHYLIPSSNLNIDRVYDAAIRANLLAQVMQDYVKSGAFPTVENQNTSEGATYYVIHPVLKHLAILSLNQSEKV